MNEEIRSLLNGINALSASLPRVKIMEVCGTHTHAIHSLGLPSVLPEKLQLVSGPGCPVCVTHAEDIHAALSLAEREGFILCCYGDMLRVPCGGRSLYSLYSEGCEVRIVLSALDALRIALAERQKQVVFFAVGFETTSANTAALIEAAAERGVTNLTVLSAHKTMPQAILSLLSGGSAVDALLCPGHVACIIGRSGFDFVPSQLGLPAAVCGFEAYDILAALLKICDMLANGVKDCVNMYPRAVSENGNLAAQRLISKIFEPCGARWRGLGEIENSGLRIRKEYERFDAARRFEIPENTVEEASDCICGKILRGECVPTACPNFAVKCTPELPLGPCMVSSEGSCAAYFNYERGN